MKFVFSLLLVLGTFAKLPLHQIRSSLLSVKSEVQATTVKTFAKASNGDWGDCNSLASMKLSDARALAKHQGTVRECLAKEIKLIAADVTAGHTGANAVPNGGNSSPNFRDPMGKPLFRTTWQNQVDTVGRDGAMRYMGKEAAKNINQAKWWIAAQDINLPFPRDRDDWYYEYYICATKDSPAIASQIALGADPERVFGDARVVVMNGAVDVLGNPEAPRYFLTLDHYQSYCKVLTNDLQ